MEEVIVHHLSEWTRHDCMGDAVCMPQTGEFFSDFVSVVG